MPRKSRADRARVANLHKVKRETHHPTVEEVEDGDITLCSPEPPPSFNSLDPQRTRHHEAGDPELLDIIATLHGAAMIDDEDEGSESESESEADGDDDVPEIREISALERFASTLQQAHDTALAAEREQEKGRTRPRTYRGNSDRTKRRCRQMRRELEAKGFHSVKDWLHQTQSALTPKSPVACNPEPSDS